MRRKSDISQAKSKGPTLDGSSRKLSGDQQDQLFDNIQDLKEERKERKQSASKSEANVVSRSLSLMMIPNWPRSSWNTSGGEAIANNINGQEG